MLDIVFRFLGLIALGALVGVVVVPLILYLSQIVAYVLAVIVVLLRLALTSQLSPKEVFKTFPKLLKESHKYMNRPIHESDATKGSICHPNAIDNGHHASVSHVITSQKPTDSKSYECSQNSLDVVKQPLIPDIPKKFRQIVHRTISFYRSYYGHSTKVEKNRRRGLVVVAAVDSNRWSFFSGTSIAVRRIITLCLVLVEKLVARK